MKFLLNFFYFFLALYLLVTILLYFFQNRIIFFPEKLSIDYRFSFGGDFEEIFLQPDANTTLHAPHFFVEKPKGVILYFHGNAGCLKDWGHVAEDFVKLDYDVLITDFRGYGKSRGAVSEKAFYEDAQAVYNFLLEKYDASQITIYGRSLGTGVAVDLASKNVAKQLILESPFSNFATLASSRYKIFPVKFLLKYQFESNLKLPKINHPIHILHGTNDEVIPYSNALQLKPILKNNSSFTAIENGGHNNLATFKIYWEKINSILK